MRLGEKIRYGRQTEFPPHVPEVDGMTNWWAATQSPAAGAASTKLDAGINCPAPVGGSWPRMPFIAIRSSPHKAGSEVTPWEDIQRPDDGYVRYFGDNKPDGSDWPHERLGNRRMLAAWRQHVDGDEQTRALAPPILVFQGFTYRGRPKGQVVFNGVGVIDRAELVVQLDPRSTRTFTNYRFDLTLLDLARENDDLDWRWLNDRRDHLLSPADGLRFAPHAWREWVRFGPPTLDRLRRNVLRGQVTSDASQRPIPGTEEHKILSEICVYYSANKHRFEALADFVTGQILKSQGIRYTAGWITRRSSDGGVDFVSRIDLDPDSGFMSSRQVVLGQAKCESPSTPTNGVDLARLVARLRRGWFGVFVTTSYFSRPVQREVLNDRYPLMLIHGARLASVVRQHLVSSNLTLGDLLAGLDAEYDTRVSAADPEQVLIG
jgi:hypothetical protein